MKNIVQRTLARLDTIGLLLGLLSLRLLLGWDYLESGLEKFHGTNWFADIQDRFPFPFNLVTPEVSWQIATTFEIVGAVALVLGIATRFFSASLIILTIVAIISVHWPDQWHTFDDLMQGYVFTDNGHGNFKLPVLFIGMLLPLMLMGPGSLSVDAWLRRRLTHSAPSGEPAFARQ